MKGVEIRSRPGRLALPCLVLFLALLVPLLEFVNTDKITEASWAGGGILGVMGIIGFFARESRVRFRFTESALVFPGTKRTIPFESMIGVARPPKVRLVRGKLQFPIDLYHSKGVFRIPSCISVSSQTVFEHLLSVIPPRDPAKLDGDLARYHEAVLAKFGPKKVHVFWKLGPVPTIPRQWVQVLWGFFPGLALGLGSVALFGAVKERNFFIGWAIFGLVITLLPYLIRGIVRFPSWWRRTPPDVLIINPLGIALRQGRLLGKLKWKDIEDVIWPGEGRFVGRETWFGIKVQVAGAFFVILSVYDRPIMSILRQIIAFWKPRELPYLYEDPEETEEDPEIDEEELEEAEELA